MGLFDFHTALSERHRQIMDSFAEREEYGSRRRVLEKALELLEALDGVEAGQVLEAYRIRRTLIGLFDFVIVNSELVEALAKAALGEYTLATLLEHVRRYTIAEMKMAQKALARKNANTFPDMAESVMFYGKHLNMISEVHVNENEQQIFAKLNVFKALPEIPLEILNTLLETSGYTFDLRLEEGVVPILTITWVPPTNYARTKEQKEKYLNDERAAYMNRIRQSPIQRIESIAQHHGG